MVCHCKDGCILKVFEKRLLRRIIGPKIEEIRGWRKIHNEKLHNFYCSPGIIMVIMSRRMRWTRHVTCMGTWKIHAVSSLKT
jgi:hypothetical protein